MQGLSTAKARSMKGYGMPIQVNDTHYYTTNEVAERLGITRQTLWRWRIEGRIPAGHKYRGRHVVFSYQELEEIKLYAHRMEPIELGDAGEQV